MDAFVQRGNLFELYGGLLKESQRRVYACHILEDMSFTEIGEELGISRQAAQEMFRRADERLNGYEAELHLQQKLRHILALAERIQAQSREEGIRQLAGEIINGI